MKRFAPLLLLGSLSALSARAATLDLAFKAVAGPVPVAFDELTVAVTSAQTVSVTRLDFLLSDIALRPAGGEWLGARDWQRYVSLREGPDHVRLDSLPTGRYDRIRFAIGLPEDLNQADPDRFPPGHALNPNVNGLHWSWLGGYIFLALEGRWRSATDEGGYSYHIATAPLRTTIEMPVALDLAADLTQEVRLDVTRLLNGLVIGPDTSSTHSRAGDPVAARLHAGLGAAFQPGDVHRGVRRVTAALAGTAPSAGATPHPFTFPSYFPRPALPLDNPLTREGVELGRRLFHDPLLSSDGTVSCASCHHAEAAFADPRRLSPGVGGATGKRHAMPLFNLAWKSSFFWDGRAPSVREQVMHPLSDPVEMGGPPAAAAERVAAAPGYPEAFRSAFGDDGVTTNRVALALEQFVLSLVSTDAKFDRVGKGLETFTPEEQRGFELFHTEFDPRAGLRGADCFHCHGGSLFSNHGFANNGLDSAFTDRGRAEATGRPGDEGRFAVPSLRNVALTAPYMHDGRFATLEEVVDHYDHGLAQHPTLDPNLAKHPLAGIRLDEADRRALVAFLKTLTGSVTN